MPVSVKHLYMASNLKELKEKCKVGLDKFQITKDRKVSRILEAFEKLYESAKSTLCKKGEGKDEEMAFVHLFRAMELWQLIKDSEEFKKHETYYKMMHGKDVVHVMTLLDELSVNLIRRYDEKSNVKEDHASSNLKSQFKVNASFTHKKRKEAGETEGVKNNKSTMPLLITRTDVEDIELRDHLAEPPVEDLPEEKFIQCHELREQILSTFQDILVLDIRPKADFKLSKISKVHCVNIPEVHIMSGLTANKLGSMILDKDEMFYWNHRDQYKQVVLMDWFSEEKDVIPSCKLDVLLNILLKWDTTVVYKHRPLVLNGGYERWLDTYPTLSTNPKTPRPANNLNSSFIHLNEHVIEYPMQDLEEITFPAPAKNVPSRPVINRSTKPESTVAEKPNKVIEPMDEDVNKTTTPQEEPLEEDKDPDENHSNPQGESPPPNVTFKERSPAETPNVSKPPTRPRTPPRTHLSQNKPDVGDGDVFLERLKFDPSARSGGGLKRSTSSPNINKLADEESNTFSKQLTPKIDRSVKPQQFPQFESFSPRESRDADTIFSASHRKDGRGLTGLKNLGNLCYMNSIMQCISNTVELTKALTRFNPSEIQTAARKQIAAEVSSLLCTLWNGDTRITSCRHLKARVGLQRSCFATNEQQDSHEFLTILMDGLHEDLNEPSAILTDGAEEATGEKAWGEFRKKNNSVVLDLFYGQLKSTVTCNSCHKQSILFEPFSNLSVPLPQDTSYDRCSIEDCLRLYLKGETISGWVCPNCKTARDATKKLDITRLPPILIIHLKRFTNDSVGHGWCRKRMNMVDFPISEFNMRPFTHPDSELRFHNYNLYAVSNHYGSMDSGHYTAYCKNHLLNKWYKFDDSDVSEMSPSDVKSSAAYILFYESDRQWTGTWNRP